MRSMVVALASKEPRLGLVGKEVSWKEDFFEK
jgi:hypothetical protein